MRKKEGEKETLGLKDKDEEKQGQLEQQQQPNSDNLSLNCQNLQRDIGPRMSLVKMASGK